MKWLSNLKFRQKLTISFIVLTLFPILVFGIYSYHIAAIHIQDKTKAFGENLTRDVNTQFNSLLQEATTVTRYMIGDQQLEALLRKNYSTYKYPLYEKTQDIKKYTFYLNHLMNLYSDMDYLLLFPINQPYVIGHSNRGNTFFDDNQSFTKEDWYKKTIQADGFWIYSDIHKEHDIVGAPKIIAISRLIKDSKTQKPLAVVKVMIDQKSLSGLLSSEENKGNFSFLLKDEHNKMIAESKEFPQSIIHDNKLSVHRDKYVVSKSTSNYTGWTVYGIVNKNLLLKELTPIKSGLIILLSITLVISILSSYLLSSSLVRPLEKLKRSMSGVMRGDWKYLELAERKDEIGDLTNHYNTMLEQLDQYVKLLIEKEKQKKDFEYKSLQAQINPHFLYNTLNTVKWCAYLEEPELVNEMIDSLVYILRFISKRTDNFITIQEECDFLRHYLSIMAIRFQNEYTIHWEFSEEINDCKIPILLIQPILENAIVYGMEKERGDRHIWLRGYKQNKRLRIEVEDNGVGFSYTKSELKGIKFNSIGLKNIQERVALIYGTEAVMEIDSMPEEGTRVCLDLPFNQMNGKEVADQ